MSEHPAVVAAVDCGTNSVRLLVVSTDGEELERRTKITRLGEGVDATGHLQPNAIGRTLEVIGEYARIIAERGPAAVRATATAAARDADNAEDLFGPARELLGVELELLPGEEEGKLSFAGATADLDTEGTVLVVDVGGGSTELVLGRPGQAPTAVTSLPMGCVRMTERFFAHDPVEPRELEAAQAEVSRILSGAVEALPQVRSAGLLVGLAGTITTLAAMELALPRHDRSLVHHFQLSRDAVQSWLRRTASEGHEARSQHPGLEPARVDTILGGTVVVAGVLDQLGYQSMMVSESDILDGLVASVLESFGPGTAR